jgi:hypothetical protein
MSNSSELATYMLYTGLVTGVNVLVACIGIVAAIIFWRRSPKAAMFCIASLTLRLLLQMIPPILFGLATRATAVTSDQFGAITMQANLVGGFIHAIAVGLMIVAVFIDRRQNHST